MPLTLCIDAETTQEMMLYLKADDMMVFINEFGEKLRAYDKYGLPKGMGIDSPMAAIIQIRKDFNNMLDDYNIRINGEY